MNRRRVHLQRVTGRFDRSAVVVTPPRVDAGGDTEFTCAGCGEVLIIARETDIRTLVIQCGGCNAFNALGRG